MLLLAAAWRNSPELKVAALCFFLVAGAAGWLSKESGERAEEALERFRLSEVAPESLQHAHEEMAEKATALGLFLSLLSLAGAVRPRSRALLASQIVVAALATGALAYTGYLGGQIRHSEIRTTAPGAAPVGEVGGDHD